MQHALSSVPKPVWQIAPVQGIFSAVAFKIKPVSHICVLHIAISSQHRGSSTSAHVQPSHLDVEAFGLSTKPEGHLYVVQIASSAQHVSRGVFVQF
jgi:hypothetical protein